MKKQILSILLTALVVFTGGAIAAEKPLIFKDGLKTARFLKTADFGSNVLSKSVLSEAAKRIPLQAHFIGTIADGSTTKIVLVPGRAGVLKAADIAALVKPAGGTNTVKVEKIVAGSPTTMLSAASFDPTSITANGTAQALALSATPSALAFNAADLIQVTWGAGTQTTDCQDACVGLELELDE